MVRCPKCGTESADQARFCRECGARLAPGEAVGSRAPVQATPEERARRLLEEAFRLSEEGRVLAAIQTCREALSINPASTSAHSLLGTLYERQGDRDAAIREYEQVVAASPGSTAERRRLNELIGVPAGRQEPAVSPRTTGLVATGAVALVLAIAIVLTTQSARPPAQGQVQRPPWQVSPDEVEFAEPAAIVPSPGQVWGAYRTGPRALAPQAVARESPVQRSGYAGAQWVGPGTYVIPGVAMAPRLRRGAAAGSQEPKPPIFGGISLVGQGPPTVSSPGWPGASGLVPVGARLSPQLARTYYLQGQREQAIAVYQDYIYRNPNAGAGTHEELAWVYAEVGDRQRSALEYRWALDRYREDLSRGHNVEAARHGVRTCESALRALETPQ